jgi:hypothetical protein
MYSPGTVGAELVSRQSWLLEAAEKTMCERTGKPLRLFATGRALKFATKLSLASFRHP